MTYEVMQRTLRYMTKLDRAIQREEDLAELSAFYKELNVSPMDLFNLLKKVNLSIIRSVVMRSLEYSFTDGSYL